MNQETRNRIREAKNYQKKAILALFPEEAAGYLEAAGQELKAMVMECVKEAVMREMFGHDQNQNAEEPMSGHNQTQYAEEPMPGHDQEQNAEKPMPGQEQNHHVQMQKTQSSGNRKRAKKVEIE